MSDSFSQVASAIDQDPAAGLRTLLGQLRAEKSYPALFEALLLAKRHELGMPLFQTSGPYPAAYEEAFVDAAREVGVLYLNDGDIEAAWPYLRAAGETKAMADAIERVEPREGIDRIIEIAFHERVHPYKGFQLLMANYGTCRAISFFEQYPADPSQEQARQLLVRTIHTEVVANLKRAIEAREGAAPVSNSIPEVIGGRDWLFGDYDYYVDTSHLASVLRFALDLRDPEALELAIELADYGKRLSPNFRYESPPPFEDLYEDHRVYLTALAGRDVDVAVDHFRAKADAADPEATGSAAGQILVTLLGRLGRYGDAVAAFEKYLKAAPATELACPSLAQLCVLADDLEPLRRDAAERRDLVTYAAARLAGKPVTSRS
jgi:hypothetical protein